MPCAMSLVFFLYTFKQRCVEKMENCTDQTTYKAVFKYSIYMYGICRYWERSNEYKSLRYLQSTGTLDNTSLVLFVYF